MMSNPGIALASISSNQFTRFVNRVNSESFGLYEVFHIGTRLMDALVPQAPNRALMLGAIRSFISPRVSNEKIVDVFQGAKWI